MFDVGNGAQTWSLRENACVRHETTSSDLKTQFLHRAVRPGILPPANVHSKEAPRTNSFRYTNVTDTHAWQWLS